MKRGAVRRKAGSAFFLAGNQIQASLEQWAGIRTLPPRHESRSRVGPPNCPESGNPVLDLRCNGDPETDCRHPAFDVWGRFASAVCDEIVSGDAGFGGDASGRDLD
jgi:hypothetical protein